MVEASLEVPEGSNFLKQVGERSLSKKYKWGTVSGHELRYLFTPLVLEKSVFEVSIGALVLFLIIVEGAKIHLEVFGNSFSESQEKEEELAYQLVKRN